MQLLGFRIKNYKVIHDTGYVQVDPRVTALLGKNESGKTSIFTALWKSFNVAGITYDRLYDYPRDRYMQDRKHNREVTALEFELSDDDIRDLVSELPAIPTDAPRRLACTTCYDGEQGVHRTFAFSPPLTVLPTSVSADDAARAAEAIANEQRDVPESVRNALPPIRHAAEKGLLGSEGREAIAAFLNAIDRWVETAPIHAHAVGKNRKYLADFLAEVEQADVVGRAETWAAKSVPAFIYFSDYDRLEGRIHLPSYLNRRRASDPRVRTQTVLFEWSGLDPEEVLSLSRKKDDTESDDDFLRRRETCETLLDTAAFTLSGDWETWWQEKRHRLHFSVDGEDLVLKVSDRHNGFPVPFEERSQGFQWFFSFYLVFLAESKRVHGGAILLLDEPGLHLHPRLQKELTGLFEHIAEENQLLYSTHLPFLIDEHRLERVRTVHLGGQDPQTTHVSNEIRPVDHRETLYPLQSTLGHSVVQTLLLGKRPIVVEGITDFWFLQALNECLLAEEGIPLLQKDTVLVPAGGWTRLIPLTFVVLASAGQNRAAVLLNGNREGIDENERMKDVFGDDVPVFLVSDLLDAPGAMIEDLVPRDVYADAAQQGRFNFSLNDNERSAATNVDAVAQLFRRMQIGEFSKAEQAKTALALTDRWNRDPSSVPAPTVEKARKLIDALSQRLDNSQVMPTDAPLGEYSLAV